MTEPRRVRVTWRHKGGRKPANVVYVGRPTRWGNPYLVAEHGQLGAVEKYRQHLTDQPDLVTAAREQLAGQDLACWCPLDQPCHADVLLDHVDKCAVDAVGSDLRIGLPRSLTTRTTTRRGSKQ